ncbi:MAG: ABC transporter permease [Rhodobacteraceae bacterium]|nr:ABC transporter permease [Paracoccaceae bacterium]
MAPWFLDLVEITVRSLIVSVSAVIIASALGIPLGAWLAVTRFKARRILVAVLNAFMGLPPVVVGLVLYLLLSRSGPFGVLELLFTTWAMVLAQVIIVLPLVASLAHQVVRDLWAQYRDLLLSLGATRRQRMGVLIWDARRSLLTAMLAGFGRAVGEVGAILIVGGNIDHLTRVLTTAITLEVSKGNLWFAVALGAVLISISLLISVSLHMLTRAERTRPW